MILYHSITCELDGQCDQPRTVDCSPRLPVVLDGCPIGDPTIPGPAVRVVAVDPASDGAVIGYLLPDSWKGPGLPPIRVTAIGARP